MAVQFYHLPGCPYCRKVEQTLEALDIEYEAHEVPPQKTARSTVKAISGQSGVPVINDPEHGVEGMAESDDIVAYLQETYT